MVILLTVIDNLTFTSFFESSLGVGPSFNTSCRWKTSGSLPRITKFILPVIINLTSSESLSGDRNTPDRASPLHLSPNLWKIQVHEAVTGGLMVRV